MTRILIPLDGSEFSAQVLDAVRRLFPPAQNDSSQLHNNCELILFQVGSTHDGYVGLPPRPASVDVPVPMFDSDREIELTAHPIYASQEWDSQIAALKDQLEPLAVALRGEGYSVRVEADLGNPAQAIIEFVNSANVDLIAMTTHGRSGINRLIFGSVAEQIVRHVAVPVLLLRPVPSPEDEHIPHA